MLEILLQGKVVNKEDNSRVCGKPVIFCSSQCQLVASVSLCRSAERLLRKAKPALKYTCIYLLLI